MNAVAKIGVSFVTAGMIFLCGCASVSADDPVDLSFSSVKAIDEYDQKELSTSRLHRAILKVEFTTRTNLGDLAENNAYLLWNKSYLCNGQKDKDYHSLSLSPIYWRGYTLSAGDHNLIKDADARGLITYYVLVEASWPAGDQSTPPWLPYDLRENPEDICVYVLGRNDRGREFRSNIVVVPKEAISAAVAKLPAAVR